MSSLWFFCWVINPDYSKLQKLTQTNLISNKLVRAEFGEKTADSFVHKYLGYFDENFAKRLFFYKLVEYLRLAISYNSVLSNPLRPTRFVV
jgi:hypothetical protein